jgi:hypothetical protein
MISNALLCMKKASLRREGEADASVVSCLHGQMCLLQEPLLMDDLCRAKTARNNRRRSKSLPLDMINRCQSFSTLLP